MEHHFGDRGSLRGFVVWRISDPVVVREDRLAYRRFAIGLGVAAVAVALAVIVADTMPIAVGGVVMMVFFAEGLTRLPGESSRASQLRSAMDGAFIGSCLLFTGLGLPGAPRRPKRSCSPATVKPRLTGMAAVVMFGIGIVVTVRARTYRRRYILLVAALGLVAVSHREHPHRHCRSTAGLGVPFDGAGRCARLSGRRRYGLVGPPISVRARHSRFRGSTRRSR